MKKGYLSAIVSILIMVLLTGCGNREQNVTENITDGPVVETSKDVFPKDYKVLLDLEDIIDELEEEPSWSMTSFGSIEAFYNFCSTMSIPKAITDIYDERKVNGVLNENEEVEFWGADALYFKIKEVTGAYYVTVSYEGADILYQGFFRNGDSLVIISVIEYRETAKYLPEKVKVFCRTEISNEGQIVTKCESLNTALLDKRSFITVMECPEFTVVYYTEINQFLCVKDSEAIGPATTVKMFIDLENIHWKGSGGLGAVNNFGVPNEKSLLIYPLIVKNDEGTSFDFKCIAEVNDFKSKIGIPLLGYIKGSSIAYPVVNGDIIYLIDGATEPNYEVAYMRHLERIAPGNPIVVNSNEVVPRYYRINYNKLQCELRDISDEGYVEIFMYNEEIQLKGEIPSPINCIKNAIKEGKFSQYSEDGECYKISKYSEMVKALEELGISVE